MSTRFLTKNSEFPPTVEFKDDQVMINGQILPGVMSATLSQSVNDFGENDVSLSVQIKGRLVQTAPTKVVLKKSKVKSKVKGKKNGKKK